MNDINKLNEEQKKQYLKEREIILKEQADELERHLQMRIRDAERLKENKNAVISVKYKKASFNERMVERYRKIWENVAGFRWEHIKQMTEKKAKEKCLDYMVLSYNYILKELIAAGITTDQIKEI
jgi:predicted ATPase